MFKGATLFLLIFVAITPQSRNFLTNLFVQTSDSLDAWAPLSYWFLAGLVAAFVLSIVTVKTWPARAEPENPLTKLKNQVPFD